jgi:hypothetical protein
VLYSIYIQALLFDVLSHPVVVLSGLESVVSGEAALPRGWRIVETDDGSGDSYYWNDETEESRWDPPPSI